MLIFEYKGRRLKRDSVFGGAVERDVVVGAPGAAFDTQNREGEVGIIQ